MMHGLYEMEFYGLHEAAHRGVICPNDTVYKKFCKWQEEQWFEKIFMELGIDADMQDLSLDSTSCKVHQHASGAKKGL